MIDFTQCQINQKAFNGSNGKKISILYNDEYYMLKFAPPLQKQHSTMPYSHSCFSEYIGSHIFESIHIPTHETMLGTYENRIVVACKGFCRRNI